MDFLTLVQEVHRESGSGGPQPASVLDQRGEALRLVNWVKQANRYIQELHSDWQFLWDQYELPIVAGTSVYSPLSSGGFSLSPNSGIAEFDRETFFYRNPSDGEEFNLPAVSYHSVKDTVRTSDTGLPFQVVLMPDHTLRFDGTPDTDTTCRFDYFSSPTDLGGNSDEPSFPVRFHILVVAKALEYYADFESAPEIMDKALSLWDEWIVKMEADQLPGDRYMHTRSEGNDMVIEVE